MISLLALQRQRDVVESLRAALARERLELERDHEITGPRHLLCLEVDRQRLAAARRALISVSTPLGRQLRPGASPIFSAFVRKMSPNDGAITTSKP